MRKIAIVFALASLASLTACDKKGADQKSEPAAAGKAAPAASEKPAAKAAAEVTAPDFFAHYSSLKGMEVLDAYPDGVTVSGTVLRTIEEMDGSLAVWLDAGDGKWVSLGFADQGAAAKARGVEKGDTVKAHCSIGGMDVKYIMNIDCELR